MGPFFITCDAHPSKGGPHVSRGVLVGTYFGMKGVRVVACTHRSRHGRVCGVLMIEFDDKED